MKSSEHPRFDWGALFDRLEAFRSSLESGLAQDAGRRGRELRRRAVELARKPETARAAGDTLEALVFALGGERYAIPVERIVEIQPLRQLTTLPGSPPWVLGIVHMGGRIIPIFDLLPILRRAEKGLSERDKVVVVRRGTEEFGLLATEIVGLRTLERAKPGEAAAVAPAATSRHVSFVTGAGVSVLDPDSLFSEETLAPAEE